MVVLNVTCLGFNIERKKYEETKTKMRKVTRRVLINLSFLFGFVNHISAYS